MGTATKAPQGVRPADKVLQALSTLAALIDSTIREVKSLDNEFQSRLVQAVQDTEASLQAQTTEHVERVRLEVSEELNGKFQNDLQAALNGIKSEFETERERFNKDLARAGETAAQLESERSGLIAQVQQVKADSAAEMEKAREELKNAVHKTEVLLQTESAESVQRARQEVQDELNSKYRKDLQTAMDGLKAEFEIERDRLNKELVQNVQAASKLEEERSGLIAEVQRVKADSAAEIEKAREDLKNAVHSTEVTLQTESAESVKRARQEVQDELSSKYRKDLQTAMEGLKAEFDSERDRLNKELLQTVPVSKLEAERSGLIAEVQRVKADSAAEIEKAREDLKNAVHNTEVTLQAESAESVRRARQEVQDELNNKYRSDLQAAMDALKSEFDSERDRLKKELGQTVEATSKLELERSGLIAQVQQVKADSAAEIEKAGQELKSAVHKTEASLQAESAEKIERARQEVQDELNSKYRKDLQTAAEGLKAEFGIERERLNKELLHTVEVASKLEAERSGLIAEVQKVKADSAAAIEKARAEAKAAAAKQPAPAATSAPSSPSAPSESLQQEIDRAETRLKEIMTLIDNPVTELSKVIRMNVEKSELEALLKGIRLGLGSK